MKLNDWKRQAEEYRDVDLEAQKQAEAKLAYSTCERCGAAYLHEHPEADPSVVKAQADAENQELRDRLLDLYTLIHDMGWTTPDDRYYSITRAAEVLGK